MDPKQRLLVLTSPLPQTISLRDLLHPQLLKMCPICSEVSKKGLGFSAEVCKTGFKLLVQPFKSLTEEDRAREISISSPLFLPCSVG